MKTFSIEEPCTSSCRGRSRTVATSTSQLSQSYSSLNPNSAPYVKLYTLISYNCSAGVITMKRRGKKFKKINSLKVFIVPFVFVGIGGAEKRNSSR